MYELPISVIVNENEWNIRNRGDYRMVLDCLGVLEDIELKPLARLYAGLIIFYEDFNEVEDILSCDKDTVEELIKQLFLFVNQNETRRENEPKKPKLIDWQADENLIIPAINNVANTEIRALEYLHWWTFLGYYMSIGESSLSTVVSIRNKIARNKKLEKHEKEFRAENPRYFMVDLRTAQQKADDEWARSIWNSQ